MHREVKIEISGDQKSSSAVGEKLFEVSLHIGFYLFISDVRDLPWALFFLVSYIVLSNSARSSTQWNMLDGTPEYI